MQLLLALGQQRRDAIGPHHGFGGQLLGSLAFGVPGGRQLSGPLQLIGLAAGQALSAGQLAFQVLVAALGARQLAANFGDAPGQGGLQVLQPLLALAQLALELAAHCGDLLLGQLDGALVAGVRLGLLSQRRQRGLPPLQLLAQMTGLFFGLLASRCVVICLTTGQAQGLRLTRQLLQQAALLAGELLALGGCLLGLELSTGAQGLGLTLRRPLELGLQHGLALLQGGADPLQLLLTFRQQLRDPLGALDRLAGRPLSGLALGLPARGQLADAGQLGLPILRQLLCSLPLRIAHLGQLPGLTQIGLQLLTNLARALQLRVGLAQTPPQLHLKLVQLTLPLNHLLLQPRPGALHLFLQTGDAPLRRCALGRALLLLRLQGHLKALLPFGQRLVQTNGLLLRLLPGRKVPICLAAQPLQGAGLPLQALLQRAADRCQALALLGGDPRLGVPTCVARRSFLLLGQPQGVGKRRAAGLQRGAGRLQFVLAPLEQVAHLAGTLTGRGLLAADLGHGQLRRCQLPLALGQGLLAGCRAGLRLTPTALGPRPQQVCLSGLDQGALTGLELALVALQLRAQLADDKRVLGAFLTQLVGQLVVAAVQLRFETRDLFGLRGPAHLVGLANLIAQPLRLLLGVDEAGLQLTDAPIVALGRVLALLGDLLPQQGDARLLCPTLGHGGQQALLLALELIAQGPGLRLDLAQALVGALQLGLGCLLHILQLFEPLAGLHLALGRGQLGAQAPLLVQSALPLGARLLLSHPNLAKGLQQLGLAVRCRVGGHSVGGDAFALLGAQLAIGAVDDHDDRVAIGAHMEQGVALEGDHQPAIDRAAAIEGQHSHGADDAVVDHHLRFGHTGGVGAGDVDEDPQRALQTKRGEGGRAIAADGDDGGVRRLADHQVAEGVEAGAGLGRRGGVEGLHGQRHEHRQNQS